MTFRPDGSMTPESLCSSSEQVRPATSKGGVVDQAPGTFPQDGFLFFLRDLEGLQGKLPANQLLNRKI